MPGVTRLPDWPERLSIYLKAAERRPFCWGTFDCVLFALGAAEAQTGIDGTSAWRGRYDTGLGALRRMKELFGTPRLEQAAEAFRLQWGGEQIGPLMAQRGDIVLADVPEPTLGVVALDGRGALFASEGGLIRRALLDCRLAWRVG